MDQTYKLLSRIAELEDKRSSINHDIKALRRVAHEALTAPMAKPFVPHVQVVRPPLLPSVPLRQQLSAPAPTQTSPVRLSLREEQLVEARKEFIADLRKTNGQEESLALLVPELERLWCEKLPCFATKVPVFKQLLNVYTPQLLAKAIVHMSKCDAVYLDCVINPTGYFRGIAQNMRTRGIANTAIQNAG
jgi:hypothetical protein